MSEEMQNEINETKEPENCKFKTLLVLTILALVLSTTAICVDIFNYANTTLNQPLSASGPNSISKKYDRGKSVDKALATKKPMIVFFYTDWCGYCQKFAPTFHKITKDATIKKNFAVAYVNCEEEANRKYVEEYGIQGFPTVYVVKENGEKQHLDNGTFFGDDAKELVSKAALDFVSEAKAE